MLYENGLASYLKKEQKMQIFSSAPPYLSFICIFSINFFNLSQFLCLSILNHCLLISSKKACLSSSLPLYIYTYIYNMHTFSSYTPSCPPSLRPSLVPISSSLILSYRFLDQKWSLILRTDIEQILHSDPKVEKHNYKFVPLNPYRNNTHGSSCLML